MLMLTRKLGQSIMIGPSIKITILPFKTKDGKERHGGKYVKLGIEAPREFQVDRLEVYERKLGGGGENL